MYLDMVVRKIIHIDTGILLVNTDGRTLEAFVGRISRPSRLHADIVGEGGQADRSDIIAETAFAGRPLPLIVELMPMTSGNA